ncbi:MAG: PAS domain S-box protein [Longimicrobiales bacterium]
MKRPYRLGLVFFIASVLWIFLSDLAVVVAFEDPGSIRVAQTVKGWLYVALATVLVVYLARRELRAVAEERRELEESEARYRNLFDRAPVPMWIYDLETLEFLEVNRAAVEHYGYTRKEFLGMTIADIRPESEVEKLQESVGAEPGLHRAGVWTHLTREGTPIQVEITSYPIAFRDRAAEFVMAVDVTTREEVHDALRRGQQTYEQLFRNSHAIMLVIDPDDGSIVDANPAAEQFYGYSADRFRTMKVSDINTADPRLLAARMAEVRQKQVHFFQFQHRLADGSVRDVEVYSGPVDLGDQRVLFSIVHDVSDLAAARHQLEHAQRMEVLGRLAGGVAHDFNNILAVIGGAAALAADSLPPNTPVRDDLDEIIRASDRGARLTRQLLAFGRKQVTRPEVLELNEALEDMADGLRRLVGEHIRLTFDLTPDPTPVYVDAGQLEQVLLNLVVNARDAIVGQGRIRVRTRVETAGEGPDRVRMEVEDNGPGIPAEATDSIFEPFFTTKDVGKGTGLGLSTVFGILEEAGGGIELDRSYEAGARFVVRLPRLEPSAAAFEPAAEPTPAVPAGAGSEPPLGPILLVEDDEALRHVMERMLTRAGYRVLGASSGKHALEVLNDRPADAEPVLVISDVVMPDLPGPAMMRALREAGYDAPVLFTSGYSPEDARDLVDHFPGSRFLEKPFTSAQLLAEVRTVLATA